jgi:N-dimethylarginine dimethylaminohydrolase
MDRRLFLNTLTLAGAGLATTGLASATIGEEDASAESAYDGAPAARQQRLNVQYEWSPLREVVVGYPLLRLSNAFPPAVGKWLEFPKDYQELFKFWLAHYPGKTLEEIALSPEQLDPRFRELYYAQVDQVNAVMQLLRSLGVVVHQIPPLTPDEQAYLEHLDGNAIQLFPRDPILVVGNQHLELPMLLPYRRRERFAIRRAPLDFLAALRIPIRSAPEPFPLPGDDYGFGPSAFLEGGDVLVFGKYILVGMSGNASNAAGVAWLKQQLGSTYRVETVRLRQDFLHLDVALCTPRPGLALVCRSAFLDGLPRFLKGWNLIDVAERDALGLLACNALVLNPRALIVVDQPAYVGEQLERAGQTVYPMPFDLVTPLGGGFRCWHHPLKRSHERRWGRFRGQDGGE